MAHDPPELIVHKEWLGQIQQVGLVVSPHVLGKHGVGVDRQRSVDTQTRLREIASDAEEPRVETFLEFASQILEWPEGFLAGAPGGPDLPESLTVALPEYEDRLWPSYAIPDLALISVVATGADLDKPLPDQKTGWRASPHARLERLLRETGVPIGLLFNHTHLRLVYAPRGESSGHLTFRFRHLLETLGRPMAGALCALLGVDRVTDVLPDAQRLPALLKESRRYQNVVSTRLAEQVLEALWHLLRGFQRANDETKGEMLAEALRADPQEVYGGLLSTLMRLVFVLYAEDRGLMPAGDVYQKHYSVSGLFERLREDAARYPDTMDARFGAWAQLLALFRLIHDGGGHGGFRFPPRHGRLFDPDVYPFLEGRPLRSARVTGQPIDPPRVPDGVVFRVLQNLLMLDGERLSYRALDVEQIGSVYEAMMGFALRQATGPSIALRPKQVVVNLAELLEQRPRDRASWLQKQAELKVTGNALADATNVEEVLALLGRKVSREYTPAPLGPAVMYLQPTEERRRSGSHYTPRSLTEPIVRTTFRPILERLGNQATPDQILDLKVCDPAMGSGAFLVEACRLLAERLVRAWELHKATPRIPEDEDALTYAKRLVAERCLYGVDKNVFAVDLAKLSLWLATLAREHPFTFLDHALRHGDSLVGLSREQIACFNWEEDDQLPLLRGLIDKQVERAQDLRVTIQGMAESDDVPEKARLLKEADEALDDVRSIGDLAVSAFFEREKPRDRNTLRATYAARVEEWLTISEERRAALAPATDPPLTFHWELEFPEVLSRANPGFDAFVGNPPFMWGNRISRALGDAYREWLLHLHPGSHGNSDIVAHFLRRSFELLRRRGCFGLVATNTVSETDTRATGLQVIVANGGDLFAAWRSVPWAGEANVRVSVIHVTRGALVGQRVLNGRPVETIGADLRPVTTRPVRRLKANQDRSFKGVDFGGVGFVLSLREAEHLARVAPLEDRFIWSVINAADLTESPTLQGSRRIINLTGLSLEEATRQAPQCLEILRERVLPSRLGQKRKANRERWWLYNEARPGLYRSVSRLARVLVNPVVAKYVSFAFLDPRMVFTNVLNVFAFEGAAAFCVLQSRVHELWAVRHASSLRIDPRYNPTDCFETFPFPEGWESNEHFESAGRDYYDFRAALMVRNGEGLTKTYNRFHDPDERTTDILELRDLHAIMDRAVLDAYGWTGIQPTCEFILDYEDDEEEETAGRPSRRRKPWRYRWPDDVRDEVLGRLLELNAERAREEDVSSTPTKVRTRVLPRRSKVGEAGGLFEDV